MIQVSNAFKENIKKRVRQIGGFAEVIVNGGYYQATEQQGDPIVIESSTKAEITNLPSVCDISPVMYKYASLELNRTLLDGSFILANEMYTNKNTGFVGDFGVSFEITGNTIPYIYNRTNRVKSVTIYFEEGYATEFVVELKAIFTDGITRTYGYSITDNTEKVVTVGGDIPDIVYVAGVEQAYLTVTGVKVTVTSWSIPNRRVRIRQINAGETLLFENKDLIEINIDEQTSLDNTEAPSNECNILLNNYDRKFNLINKNSVLNRLGKTTYIRPFIGVSVGGGIEYVDMGSYNYSSYTENQNKTISLYGSGAVETYATLNNFLWQRGLPDGTVNTTLVNMGLQNNEVGYNGTVYLENTETENKREQLQALAIFSNSIIKENRLINTRLESILSLKKMSPNSLDRINLLSQISEPKITKKNKVKTVKIYNTQIGELDNTEKVLVDNYTAPISDGRMVINITSSSPVDVNSLKVYVGGVQIQQDPFAYPGYVVYNSYYAPRIEIVNLTNEENIGIKVVGKEYRSVRVENSITNGAIVEGETIEYNSNYINNSYQKTRVAKHIFNNEKDYSFEVEFNGDPSLEIGDTITFETVDGDMIGVIESLNTKFNGGLRATIKGVCNSVLQ